MNRRQKTVELIHDRFKGADVTGVEIGTGCADLTVSLLALPEVRKIYTIDTWKDFSVETAHRHENNEKIKKIALARLSEYKGRVEIFDTTSEEAFFLLKDRQLHLTLDFCWIHGYRSKDQMKKDLRYEMFVKRGGIIGGYDFTDFNSTVSVIKEKYGGRIYTGEDSTWWVFV